ncbi:cytochrome P450 [Mycena metata]|uniref:Cytochrome P450 n=1 Tax=Mycena metata TaxID=1033252 RepID=A0AAD7NNB0_9AGAR|nr:cytochrome P450 [Mycena metata]
MTFAIPALALAIFAVSVYRFTNDLKSVNHIPGMRPLFAPFSLFGAAFGTRWWNPGLNWPWEWRKSAFFNHTHDVISIVPVISGGSSVYTCSMDVAKQILAAEGKTQLFKPRRIVAGLLLWGENIVAASGDMWKRHRRIVAPALTSKTYALLIIETIATYREMVDAEGWRDNDHISVTDFNRLPRKLALILIARCGFGLPMPWVDAPTENGLTFGKSLTIVTETVIPRLVIPTWLYKFPIERIRIIEAAWSGLGSFMHTFLESRKDELQATDDRQRGDILSRLVTAMDSVGKVSLNEQEVLGNIFTLMFAGHETTASVITATLGYLAIYEDEQEKAYAEIIKVIPERQDPTMDVLQNLPHLLACFHEAMRIYPAGVAIVRELTEDITIKVKRPTEEQLTLQQGTLVVVDMIALHHNPNVFSEPDVFRPSRWYGVPEHDISMFGMGPRACIGRKFSHTEALCFLFLFLRDWKISVPLRDGETRKEYEERVMGKAGMEGLVLGVGPISLKMTRR